MTPPPIPQPPPPRPPPPIPADPLAQLAVATQAPRQHGSSAKPGATPAGTRTAASRCLGLVTLVLLVIGAVWLLIGSGDGGDHGSSLPISPTTFVDFDSRFCVHSRLTDLQKSREIERLKGTRVRWEGVVSHVSEDAVGVKHKTTTLTYDVLLRIPEAGRAVLPMLGDGEKIVYEGTINDYGTVLPHGLKDGRVISHSPLNDGDRLIFLADTETTVMNAILGKSGE